MNIREKLQAIQKITGLTQVKMAERLDVSFTAFNSWWTGKAVPRPKKTALIEELFLEVTGQKIIPDSQLATKKKALAKKASEHQNVIKEILDNPDIRDAFVLKLTYNSNRIEGSTLTEPDTAAILFDNVALPDKSLTEQLEAKNHQTALNYLFNYLAANGKLDEKLILRLHGILMNGVRPDAGAYRSHAVRILGVSLPTVNYLKVPELMPKIMVEANKKTNDIVALSAAVHSRFEQVHPFADGNGRIGRLLMTAMLLRADLAPAIIKQEQKQLYYTYLYKAQSQGEQSQLENFLSDAIMDGFRILERM